MAGCGAFELRGGYRLPRLRSQELRHASNMRPTSTQIGVAGDGDMGDSAWSQGGGYLPILFPRLRQYAHVALILGLRELWYAKRLVEMPCAIFGGWAMTEDAGHLRSILAA